MLHGTAGCRCNLMDVRMYPRHGLMDAACCGPLLGSLPCVLDNTNAGCEGCCPTRYPWVLKVARGLCECEWIYETYKLLYNPSVSAGQHYALSHCFRQAGPLHRTELHPAGLCCWRGCWFAGLFCTFVSLLSGAWQGWAGVLLHHSAHWLYQRESWRPQLIRFLVMLAYL